VSVPEATAAGLRRLSAPAAPGAVSVVCFPHAGGTAGFFRPWARLVPDRAVLHAVQYPGRQDRIAHPPARDMDGLVGPLAEALAPAAGPDLVLFGHSMGAAVAYEVARALEARTGRALGSLVVSGRPSPRTQRDTAVSAGGEAAVLEDVRRLGGTDPALFGDEQVRDLVLPSIRADYALIEGYGPRPGPPLATPVLAVRGTEDPEVTAEEARDWASVTHGEFRSAEFPGGHFYLIDRPGDVVGALLAQVGLAPADDPWPSTP
jgi:pyochelin biosynthetic protein PchC